MAQESMDVVDIMSLPQADSFSDTDTLILQKKTGSTQRGSSKQLKDYINSDFMTSIEKKEENLEQEYQNNKALLESYANEKKSEMDSFVSEKQSQISEQFGDISENEQVRQEKEQERETKEAERVTAEDKRNSEFSELKTGIENAIQEADSLNVETEETDNSYVVKITNKEGVSSTSPNLLNVIQIGTVQTGGYEDGASATITGSFGEQKLNLRIPVGKPFAIKKSYQSVSEMENSIKTDLEIGEFCVIDTGSVEDIDTGKLYMRNDSENGYQYLTDLSGAQGIQGPVGKTGETPNLTIGTVDTGEEGSKASATITGTKENPVLNLVIPRGMTGKVENISGASIPFSSSSDEKSIKDVVEENKTEIEGKLGKDEQAHDSATVNGHTVESDVPENAKFTDTIPTIDSQLSADSENAVQNKVVTEKITEVEISLEEAKGTTLTATLATGSTTLEIANDAIKTTSTVDLYTDVYGVSPTDAIVTDGKITLTFKEQTKDISVKAVIK